MLLQKDMSDDRPAWPTGKLTWDASTTGIHLTEVHLTTGLCDQYSYTHGHQMSLHGGWVRLTFCVLGSHPASQLQLASQPPMWQDINLSGFGLVGYVVPGGPGAQPHWAPECRLPALPLVPLGEWPTWPKPGKWHKWPLQPVIYLWHYIEWPFAVSYLCCLITYSCTHCRGMLSGLCSLLTNLHISFHHQSDILLQQSTTFLKLLSHQKSEMQWTKSALDTSELRSTRPNSVLVLATQCLWWGEGGQGCRGMGGYIWKIKTIYCKVLQMVYCRQ